MRTLIYARYSSALQNPRSVADQIAACRDRAACEGWTVVGEYDDHAISGAAGIDTTQRPGLFALLERVEAGGIDQVLTESTDRIARHQGDAFTVRERLDYAGCRLFTLMDGVVDEISGTIKGLFDARFRKDLALRVRRGHIGNVKEGRAMGSVAYGYRRVSRFDERGNSVGGLREVDEDQAAIVRRVFREYAAGRSPLQIVTDLNAEGVPPPKRGIWRPSTLIGHRAVGFGILSNPVYVGRIVYGRSKQVRDPRTRQRRMVPGTDALHEGAAPELRIVEDAIWQEVQEQIAARASPRHQERQRRPKRVLSGLGVCGVCGSNWVIRHGRQWGCSAISGGACTNNRLITTERYESEVLAELQSQMLAPDVVSAYLREYHREHARQSGELTRGRDRLERKHAEAARKVQRLLDAIADGGSDFAEIRQMLTDARDERDRLARELDSLDALPVLTLHPGLADQYRQSIGALAEALADPETKLEAIPRVRKLIARIVLTPAENERGVTIQVVRQIDEILKLATTAPQRAVRRQVAG